MEKKIAYRSPHAAEIIRTASKKVNPTVAGFRCANARYATTISAITKEPMAKRTGALCRMFTAQDCSRFDNRK